MLAKETMQHCLTIHPDTSLEEAARLLRRGAGRPLVVQGDLGKPFGVITEQDIASAMPSGRWALRASEADRLAYLRSVSVRSICRGLGPCVSPESTMTQARAIMRRHRLSSLPVLSRGRVIGMVSLFGFVDSLLPQALTPAQRVGAVPAAA